MQPQIEAFRNHVREMSHKPGFVHNKWFVKWHLEVVERLALELCDHYPQVDRDLISVLAWLHDYGKLVDFDNQYMMTQIAGREALAESGLPSEFIAKAVSIIETMDRKMEFDLTKAPIEVQIISSADGCSHMVGPFMKIFWHEATDQTFTGKTIEELMALDIAKLEKDWQRKIVLPEARAAFQVVYDVQRSMGGQFPAKFFS